MEENHLFPPSVEQLRMHEVTIVSYARIILTTISSSQQRHCDTSTWINASDADDTKGVFMNTNTNIICGV